MGPFCHMGPQGFQQLDRLQRWMNPSASASAQLDRLQRWMNPSALASAQLDRLQRWMNPSASASAQLDRLQMLEGVQDRQIATLGANPLRFDDDSQQTDSKSLEGP